MLGWKAYTHCSFACKAIIFSLTIATTASTINKERGRTNQLGQRLEGSQELQRIYINNDFWFLVDFHRLYFMDHNLTFALIPKVERRIWLGAREKAVKLFLKMTYRKIICLSCWSFGQAWNIAGMANFKCKSIITVVFLLDLNSFCVKAVRKVFSHLNQKLLILL